MDSLGSVREARSATSRQRGTGGAGREWSGSQAGFSNSRAARYRGSGRRMVRQARDQAGEVNRGKDQAGQKNRNTGYTVQGAHGKHTPRP
ncbi:unnamed protein product [Staurois parvus]|uniref:Uncharacterized protein n=1 Tax=Staurois parvus TaxID=386267 RepID=A0ABN9DA37_9NEOB|nr:unnamed protein product [Staurois parvus]